MKSCKTEEEIRALADWKISIQFTKSIYKVTVKFPEDEKIGRISQLGRATLPVPTDITEGLSRNSFKDQTRFSTIAFGTT